MITPSRAAEVTAEFVGEERLFRLGIKQLRRLQETCDAGPMGLLVRIRLSIWAMELIGAGDLVGLARLDTRQLARGVDVRETILQGLLGAEEISGPEALELVQEWVDKRPIGENLDLALRIAAAAVVSIPDEPLGEQSGEGTSPTPSPTES